MAVEVSSVAAANHYPEPRTAPDEKRRDDLLSADGVTQDRFSGVAIFHLASVLSEAWTG
jgi:hypothetical protein